jgi:hypothetical protein
MAHTILGPLGQLRGAENRRNRQTPEQMPNIRPAAGSPHQVEQGPSLKKTQHEEIKPCELSTRRSHQTDWTEECT